MNDNIKLDPNKFWTLWEILPPEVQCDYCGENDREFDLFRNDIKMSEDADIVSLMSDMIISLLNYTIGYNKDTIVYVGKLSSVYYNIEENNE